MIYTYISPKKKNIYIYVYSSSNKVYRVFARAPEIFYERYRDSPRDTKHVYVSYIPNTTITSRNDTRCHSGIHLRP